MKTINAYLNEAIINRDLSESDIFDNFVDLGLKSGNLWGTTNYKANEEYESGEYYDSKQAIAVVKAIHDNSICMPNAKDCIELLENTSTKHVTVNKVKCVKFTSTINNNYIIIPCAGYKTEYNLETQLINEGELAVVHHKDNRTTDGFFCWWNEEPDVDGGFASDYYPLRLIKK